MERRTSALLPILFKQAAKAFRDADPDTALEELQVKAATMLQIGEQSATPEKPGRNKND